MAENLDPRLPAILGRHLAIDERGVGLQATWRPAHGFINVSLWRDDQCVETFHLTPRAAGDLVAFLAGSLANSVPLPSSPRLRVVNPPDGVDRPQPSWFRRVTSTTRSRLAEALDAMSLKLRR